MLSFRPTSMVGSTRTPLWSRLGFALLAAVSSVCTFAQDQSHLIGESASLSQTSIFQPPQQTGTPPPPSTVDHLHGVVVSSLTAKPVARVLVGGIGNLGVLTDSQGRFTFDLRRPLSAQTGSSPSSSASPNNTTTLQFMLRKPGFLQRTASAIVPTYTPASPEPEIVLKITPAAIITGHLSVDSGTLPQLLNLQLRRRQIIDGSATYMPVGNTIPNPEGDFRFADLQPGDYKLLTLANVTPAARSGAPQPDSVRGILPAFYPEAASLDDAAPVHLGAGQTRNADLNLRSATFYRVTVPVASSGPGANIAALLNPQDTFSNLSYNTREGVVSGFLPPGTYTLQLNSAGPRPAARPGTGSSPAPALLNSGIPDREAASVTLHVGAGPLRTPPIALHPGIVISINVRRDFTEPDNTPTYSQSAGSNPRPPISVSLVPLHTGAFQSTGNLQTSPTGDLTLHNVSDGAFRVHATSTGTGYIASMSCGGVDLLREPLVIGPDSNPPAIEITLRNDPASLKINLNDGGLPGEASGGADNPLSAVSILAISLDNPERPAVSSFMARHPSAQLARFFTAAASQLANLPPGRYLVLAFDANPFMANEVEYHNPKVLESLIPKGVVVTLAPTQKTEITVPLLANPESD